MMNRNDSVEEPQLCRLSENESRHKNRQLALLKTFSKKKIKLFVRWTWLGKQITRSKSIWLIGENFIELHEKKISKLYY